MSDELKKENELNSDEFENSFEEFDTEKEVLLKEEEMEFLSEEVLIEYVQRTEFAIDKLELGEIEDDETYDYYLKLKKQEKMLNKKIKVINKEIKEKGFFDYVKPWMAIYMVIAVVFAIFPVNPFLPLYIIDDIMSKGVYVGETLFYVLYACYNLIFIVPGFLLCIFHKRKTKEQRLSQRAFLIMMCVATVITLISVVIYIVLSR